MYSIIHMKLQLGYAAVKVKNTKRRGEKQVNMYVAASWSQKALQQSVDKCVTGCEQSPGSQHTLGSHCFT